MKRIRIKTRIKVPSIFKQPQRLSVIKKAIVSTGALFLTAVAILAIAQVGKMPLRGELHEGDVSIKDIYAPFDFSYTWGIDKERTKAVQEKAVLQVHDVYIVDSKLLKDAEVQVNIFFDNVAMVKNSQMPINEQTYDELKGMFNIQLSMDVLKEIVSFKATPELRQISISALNNVLSQPIISEEDKQKLFSEKEERIMIKTEQERKGHITKVADILLLSQAKQKIRQYVDTNLNGPRSVKKAALKVLVTQLTSNLSYSEKETQAARKAVEESVKPFYAKHKVKKDEIIIFKGERTTAGAIAKLSAIKSTTERGENFPFLSSFALILLLLFFILAIYTKIFEPKMLKDNTGAVLICILLLLIVALTKTIILSPLPSYFIPAASVSMLFILLVGNTVVFPLIITTSVIISLMAGAELNIFMVSFIGAAVGVFVVKKARRRTHLIKTGLYLGVSNFVCIASFGILNDLELAVFLKEGLWGIGGGIFAAAITMVCLPILERMFHLTSDIGLLELSDLNHPLLKEMASKASGTYHHSLIVGNLAEAACDAIGANSLLARVGAYYHDIGKIAKAEYFSENQPKVSTSHENLTPHMSSLIITNHVKDGVDIAKKYRLPKPIADMIEQHHGTGLIYYFYQKALEREREEDLIKEEGFRYAGPKPQTKETAIILLADSVEAASRALAQPTPARLEELVRRIMNNKFIDRQLDECELTLHEINIISKSFVRILLGIYHARVEYPNNGAKPEKKKRNSENRDPKQSKENQNR